MSIHFDCDLLKLIVFLSITVILFFKQGQLLSLMAKGLRLSLVLLILWVWLMLFFSDKIIWKMQNWNNGQNNKPLITDLLVFILHCRRTLSLNFQGIKSSPDVMFYNSLIDHCLTVIKIYFCITAELMVDIQDCLCWETLILTHTVYLKISVLSLSELFYQT